MSNKGLPDHLGGQTVGNVDIAMMTYVNEIFPDIKTVFDVGCGNGHAIKTYAEEFGYEYTGFDGDWTVLPKNDNYVLHDFSLGPVEFDPPDITVDLAYSVEFLEHVYEEYQENYMDIISRGRYAVVTAALPGQPGRHHVNCRPQEYWVEVFAKYGFEFLEEETATARERSINKSNAGQVKPEKAQYFKKTGLIFRKKA